MLFHGYFTSNMLKIMVSYVCVYVNINVIVNVFEVGVGVDV